MLTFKGEYNSADLMIDSIDEVTVRQIYGFLNHPAFAKTKIKIMPDAHAGTGAVIGFTMTMGDSIIPNIVGVDIGCGMLSYKLTGITDIDFAAFDEHVRTNIPAGFNKRNRPAVARFADLGRKVIGPYKSVDGVDIEQVISSTSQVPSDVLHSLGTLGGGNHFIEIDKTPTNELWLTVHSGSRNFGLKVANWHQKKAKALMKEIYHTAGDVYRDLEYLPMEQGGDEYIHDMQVAQFYAFFNRTIMMEDMLRFFKIDFNPMNSAECVHNYISPADNIIRKGAIAAYKDEKVIIPLNMLDGIIIGKGKGNIDWNNSAPHGAGRLMSRSKAKKELDLKVYQDKMKGIWSSCINQSTIDESPMAYKDMTDIVNTIGPTVDIEYIMKPVYVFKSSVEGMVN